VRPPTLVDILVTLLEIRIKVKIGLVRIEIVYGRRQPTLGHQAATAMKMNGVGMARALWPAALVSRPLQTAQANRLEHEAPERCELLSGRDFLTRPCRSCEQSKIDRRHKTIAYLT
jgi:hypothetical protein